MKVAIISDVHNNISNLKKVLDYCKKNQIEEIICCGDLASLETLDFINDNFYGEVYYCFGNMDDDYLKNLPCQPDINSQSKQRNFGLKTERKCRYKRTMVFKNFGEVVFESELSKNYKIGFVHFPDIAEQLCKSGKYDYVFYGHTHKPWMKKINECIMLNPGNVAGEIYPPTFAVWETENERFKLLRINDEASNVMMNQIEVTS